MYWQHKTDNNKQILISRCDFPQDTSIISLPWESFSLETCPIPLEEFENYLDIPSGISEGGFTKIKDFFSREKAHDFICFTGITGESCAFCIAFSFLEKKLCFTIIIAFILL